MSWDKTGDDSWGAADTGGGSWNAGATTGNDDQWGNGAAVDVGDVGDVGYTATKGDTNVTNGHASGGDAGDGADACRNCGATGHFARECPQPRKGGGCFNCGEEGHSKAECTNPKVFTGACRLCNQEGHAARDCPTKPAVKCFNCQQEGHAALDCKEPRVIDQSNIADKSPEDAWKDLIAADQKKDLDDIKESIAVYCKAVPGTTFHALEQAFRTEAFNTYLIALEKDIASTWTIVDLQGKLDCKYLVGYYFSSKPKRKTAAQGWPANPEENLERLKDAGVAMDRGVPKCHNCNELGHTARACTEDKIEKETTEVKCVNCDEVGHRARDCTQARTDRFACRNCKQSGHTAAECTEPRSAEGVECKRCNETGHFAKDCPNSGGNACRNCGEEGHISKDCDKPKNPANVTCRNCEKVGHFTRECPEKKDWSKVKCNNCGEMGHTVKRCTAPLTSTDNAGHGDTSAAAGDLSGDVGHAAPAVEAAGDWDNPTEGVTAW